MSGVLSKKKIEELAVAEITNYVNEIKTAIPNITKGDNGLSWDGYIRLFKNNDIEKKDNFLADLDVQVKGTEVFKEKKGNNYSYPIEIKDLENYKKKNGTLFFVVTINTNNNEKKRVYCKPLLKEELNRFLKKGNTSTVSVKLKEITKISQLESILYNFNKDREMQSKISDKVLDSPVKIYDNNNKLFFYEYNKTNPLELVGEEKYAYMIDVNDNITGLINIKIDDFATNTNVIISTMDKKIVYENVIYKVNTKEKFFCFGESFVIKEDNKMIIKIKGSLNERIKDLEFINQITKDNKLLINEHEIEAKMSKKQIDNFNGLLKKYKYIKDFLDSRKIEKDLDFNQWEENDFETLFLLMNGLDNKIKLRVEEWNTSVICPYGIKDLTLSIIATMQEDGTFIFETFFNNEKDYSFTFEYTDGRKIGTQNKYLGLDRNLYLCDDFNRGELIRGIEKFNLSEEENELINRQVLEMIFAYDSSGRREFLDLANYYLSIIENSIDDNIVNLNKYQIKKRLETLSEEDEKEIKKIKDSTDDEIIDIGCSILLESYKEARLAINRICESTRAFMYREFPIINLLRK